MVSEIKNNRVNTPPFIEMTKIVGGVVWGWERGVEFCFEAGKYETPISYVDRD